MFFLYLQHHNEQRSCQSLSSLHLCCRPLKWREEYGRSEFNDDDNNLSSSCCMVCPHVFNQINKIQNKLTSIWNWSRKFSFKAKILIEKDRNIIWVFELLEWKIYPVLSLVEIRDTVHCSTIIWHFKCHTYIFYVQTFFHVCVYRNSLHAGTVFLCYLSWWHLVKRLFNQLATDM